MPYYWPEMTDAEILEKYGPSNNGSHEDDEGDGSDRDPESWKLNDM